MKMRAVAWTLLCLWLVSPGVVKAESRAFDFSAGTRSARLLDRSAPRVRGWAAGGERVRAFAPVSVTVTTEDPVIPTELWLVPLVLTGTGFLLGVTWCAVVDARDSECNQAMLTGLAVGGLATLGYFLVRACAGDEACVEECTPEDEDCGEETAMRGARSKPARSRGRGALALPLGLAPKVGFVNDRAVFGLGARF